MTTPEGPPLRTSGLLAELARTGEGDTITLGMILEHFRSRAYGVLLILVLLPAFIPLPAGAGAVSGVLVSLIGVQMLLMRRHPWLPQRALRRPIQRSTLARFARRMERVLGPLEHACRPRLVRLTRDPLTLVFTGLQLLLLGVLLALPLPLTNYVFALLLMLYAIAIIERDGALLLGAWILGIVAIVASIMLSSQVVELVQRLAA